MELTKEYDKYYEDRSLIGLKRNVNQFFFKRFYKKLYIEESKRIAREKRLKNKRKQWIDETKFDVKTLLRLLFFLFLF